MNEVEGKQGVQSTLALLMMYVSWSKTSSSKHDNGKDGAVLPSYHDTAIQTHFTEVGTPSRQMKIVTKYQLSCGLSSRTERLNSTRKDNKRKDFDWDYWVIIGVVTFVALGSMSLVAWWFITNRAKDTS